MWALWVYVRVWCLWVLNVVSIVVGEAVVSVGVSVGFQRTSLVSVSTSSEFMG